MAWVKEQFKVAFKIDEFTEPKREFRGRIVRAEWGTANPDDPHYNPWVFPENAPEDIRERQKERGAMAIRIEIMPLDQSWDNIYEWYTVTNVRLSKWYYFIDALTRLNIPFDTSGDTTPEKLTNFCRSLVGVEAKWVDHEDLPTIGKKTIKRLLLPVEYYGKFEAGGMERVVI
jgi:hypothetical protein